MIKQGRARAVGAIPVADGNAVLASGVETDGVQLFWLGEPALVDATEVAGDTGPAQRFEDMLGAALEQIGSVDLGGVAWSLEDDANLPQGVDAQILADALGYPLVINFAGADMGAGGVGRCLDAPFYHALARYLGFDGLIGFVKIEKRATLYLVDALKSRPEADGAMMVVECGPGNLVPPGGEGDPQEGDLLAQIMEGVHFSKMPPKWLGEDDLHDMLAALDTGAQLNELIATAIALAVDGLERRPSRLILCGEGAGDDDLVRLVKAGVDKLECLTAQEAGCSSNLLGGHALGYLAARVLRGQVTSVPATTGCSAPVGGGDVLYPR